MIRGPPRSTRTYTLFPYTTRVRSATMGAGCARAGMVYLVQRAYCDGFRIAADIDPAYARALDRARSQGVETLCYGCVLTTEGIEVAGDRKSTRLNSSH